MSAPSLFKSALWRARGYHSIEELKRFGLKIGKGCKIMERVTIDPGHCGHIEIGNHVTIAPQASLIAHDTSPYLHFGYTLIGKIKIEDGVFIGAGAIILPNVTIGKNSIVGAGSVIAKDVPPNVVVAGNPAQEICSLKDFLDKHQKQLKAGPKFGDEFTQRKGVTPAMMKEMNRKMKKGWGYVK